MHGFDFEGSAGHDVTDRVPPSFTFDEMEGLEPLDREHAALGTHTALAPLDSDGNEEVGELAEPPSQAWLAKLASIDGPAPRTGPRTQRGTPPPIPAAARARVTLPPPLPMAVAVGSAPLTLPRPPSFSPIADLLEPNTPIPFVEEDASTPDWFDPGATMMVSRHESSARRLRTAIAIGIASFVVIVAFAASRANHRANTPVASLAFLDDSQPSVSSIPQAQTQPQTPGQPQPVALPIVQPPTAQPVIAAPAAQVQAPAAATPTPAESPAPATVQPVAAPVQTHSKSQLWTHAKALTTTPTVSTPAVATALTAANGILMISTKPPCEIIVDGKPTHLVTPQRSLTLGAGPHQLTLINTQQGIRRTAAVTIDSHHPTKLIQDYLTH